MYLNFEVNLLNLFCNLDNFSAMQKLVYNNETVQPIKRASKLPPKTVYRIGLYPEKIFIETFYGRNLQIFLISKSVLWVRSGAHPRVPNF